MANGSGCAKLCHPSSAAQLCQGRNLRDVVSPKIVASACIALPLGDSCALHLNPILHQKSPLTTCIYRQYQGKEDEDNNCRKQLSVSRHERSSKLRKALSLVQSAEEQM